VAGLGEQRFDEVRQQSKAAGSGMSRRRGAGRRSLHPLVRCRLVLRFDAYRPLARSAGRGPTITAAVSGQGTLEPN
jgi:hypothetical protein